MMSTIEETKYTGAKEECYALIDALPQFVWIIRPDGSVASTNQRWRDYSSLQPQYAGEQEWFQHLHFDGSLHVQDRQHMLLHPNILSDQEVYPQNLDPGDRERVLALRRQAFATGEPYTVEYRLREGRTGAQRWFLVQGVPQRNAQGTIRHWVVTCTNIDDQKRAEQRIKESEENLRVLAETVPQLVWTTLPDGSVSYWNHRWYDYIGFSSQQSLGHEWSQFLHPDDFQQTLTIWHHALATGEPYEIEYRLKDGRTGSYRWFLVRGMPVRDDAGQIVRWFGTCTDIDKQKCIEEALRQSQERVSALTNSNIIGINLIEGEQIVDANDTFLRMTGYTREDLQAGNMNWLHMTPPEYRALTQQAHQELTTRKSITPYEKEYYCQDGSRLPVLVGGVLFQDQPFQAIGFVLDNSARKELEQRKDTVISMASHELNTPLTALKLQTTLLRRQLAKQGTLDQAPVLASMETQLNKVNRLVGELLDVSKIQAGRLEYVQEPVDLDALLREITETMQHMSRSHTLVVRGAVRASLIGDRDRLGQVFTNLLSNAIKYSPDAQTVEMDLSASEEGVTARIHDHGLGIPREQRDKIFDRFYRVPDLSQRAIPGLGMGLYIVAEIVKHHGGTITVDSALGKGSTFTVTLPHTRAA